ncbi:MAG: CpsD/CapB family tyrosine-protein kinase [PVC group bacterium]|nr:CpsD/CapB family tyrosine-protein kinase [PVC group bacterium]
MKNFLNVLKGVHDSKLSSLTIPSLPKEFVLKSVHDSNIDPHIVTHFYPKSPISEQYLRLRESIKNLNKSGDLKTVAVTSSVAEEGKTITALNLAIAMTKDVDCRKVLLVDCDLRRGQVAPRLDLHSKAGLSEYLMLGADVDNILYKTKIDKLTIIPRGKIADNPVELLASAKMKDLMKKLKEKFDFIILDSPPLVPVADAGIVCSVADGVIMAVRAGGTQRGIVKHATELLLQSHSNLLGYILTNVEYHIPEYLYRYV